MKEGELKERLVGRVVESGDRDLSGWKGKRNAKGEYSATIEACWLDEGYVMALVCDSFGTCFKIIVDQHKLKPDVRAEGMTGSTPTKRRT